MNFQGVVARQVEAIPVMTQRVKRMVGASQAVSYLLIAHLLIEAVQRPVGAAGGTNSWFTVH